MIVSTLSGKNQTTIGMEYVKALGLKSGSKLKQTVDGSKLVIEPIGELMAAFGSLSSAMPRATNAEEDAAIEQAVADEYSHKVRST